MHQVRSFPPITAPDAGVVILGSMPGVASLEAGRYYAHPRNAFWPIMDALLGSGLGLPYEERCRKLIKARVAVWDVLKTCRRKGSLDSAIERESEQANDFAGFFCEHPKIARVLFNGQKAHDAFRRYAAPGMAPEVLSRLTLTRLPSTSPANAGWSFERKLAAWREALEGR